MPSTLAHRRAYPERNKGGNNGSKDESCEIGSGDEGC
jgi:hypothetical protein